MEIVILLVLVGLVVVGVLALVGAGGRGDVRREDSPDEVQLTGTDATPPSHPERPVPGSAPDRARKGKGAAPDGSDVARRRS